MTSPDRSWLTKFRDAFRGLWVGVARQNSFIIHLLAAIVALVAALLFGVTPGEWCVLVIAITVVLVAELFNTALEHMAKAVTEEHHPEIRDALDTAAAAVLVAAAGSVIIGIIIFAPYLLKLLQA